MDIPDLYTYLVRARRDLWDALAALPDDLLTRDLLPGDRFRCIKDLLFHIPSVEDFWLHEDILRDDPVLLSTPALAAVLDDAPLAPVPLAAIVDYWQAVERSTLGYLATFDAAERARIVTVHDAPDERYAAGDLMMHVMLHEARHTAQVAVLLRQQGIKPPALDLLWYLVRR